MAGIKKKHFFYSHIYYLYALSIYSFIYSQCFILVRVVVNLISGTLGIRLIKTLGLFSMVKVVCLGFFGIWRIPEETQADMERTGETLLETLELFYQFYLFYL